MVYSQVVYTYAQAFLQLAIQTYALESVYGDIVFFQKLCINNATLSNTLQSPIVSNKKKWHILQGLLKNQMHPLVLRFFYLVVQKYRTKLLLDMCSCFIEQYEVHKNIQTAHITIPIPLSDKFIEQFKKLVQSIIPCQEVKLIQHIKPAIIGGFILQVGDKRLDESLRTKLRLVENIVYI